VNRDLLKLDARDKKGIGLHQAWENYKISPTTSLKIG
jgi:hypothetical protein|tara:strand:+ start:441 stop:551 length:111 start_codon:yes stop_codon:yes gene_type:complete